MANEKATENTAGKKLVRNRATKKHGHYLPSPVAFYPPTFYESVLNALTICEQEKGRSVYLVEVCQVHKRVSWWFTFGGMVIGALYELFRNDQILGDKELTRWSVNPDIQRTVKNPTEFELYSDRHERLFSNFNLDEGLRLRPGPQTKVANFEEIR